MPTLNIADILKIRDFPTGGRKIMLARHTLNDPLQGLIDYVRESEQQFAEWQAIQRTENKDGKRSIGARLIGCDFVMSFCKIDGERARFAGMFRNESGDSPKVLNPSKLSPPLTPRLAEIYREKIDTDEREGIPAGRFFFQLRKVENIFADLEGRVIVDWFGNSNWIEPFAADEPKKILAITPEKFAPFHG